MATKESTKKASRKTAPAVAVAQVGEVALENIVAATLDAERGFLHTSPAVHTPLIEAGLVEINTDIINEAGEVATRATEKGIKAVQTNHDESQAVETVAGKNGFVLEADIAVPTIKRGGRGGEVYPFDAMTVGQSFFVAASEAKPNPAKSLASTVSSATARYAEEKKNAAGEVETKTNKKGEVVPVMVETRKFIVRSVEEKGVKGARIWRTQ